MTTAEAQTLGVVIVYVAPMVGYALVAAFMAGRSGHPFDPDDDLFAMLAWPLGVAIGIVVAPFAAARWLGRWLARRP